MAEFEIEIPESAFEAAAEALEPFGLAHSDAYDAASDAVRAAMPGIQRAFGEMLADIYRGHAPEDAAELRVLVWRIAGEFADED